MACAGYQSQACDAHDKRPMSAIVSYAKTRDLIIMNDLQRVYTVESIFNNSLNSDGCCHSNGFANLRGFFSPLFVSYNLFLHRPVLKSPSSVITRSESLEVKWKESRYNFSLLNDLKHFPQYCRHVIDELSMPARSPRCGQAVKRVIT